MTELPVALENGLIYFTDDVVAGVGHHLHARMHPVHTHSFIEIMFVTSGDGVHLSQLGRNTLAVRRRHHPSAGRVARPRDCHDLQVINCCFDVELLRRELAWTREDPLLASCSGMVPTLPGRVAC